MLISEMHCNLTLTRDSFFMEITLGVASIRVHIKTMPLSNGDAIGGVKD